jgi:ribosome biogenesis GTPase
MKTPMKGRSNEYLNSKLKLKGTIIKGVGGLYYVMIDSDNDSIDTLASSEVQGVSNNIQDPAQPMPSVITYANSVIQCRARGLFRKDGIMPTVGDRVIVETFAYSGEAALSRKDESVITEILPRRSILTRPSVANIDIIFVIISAAKPAPSFTTSDRLICIVERAGIEPVVIVTKRDLDESKASEIVETYEKCGIRTFCVSATTGEGTDLLYSYIASLGEGALTAFAGVSGAGKSTLLNRLYPNLNLKTGDISRKTQRGRHTTRHVELLRTDVGVFIADTPGFSFIDFEHAGVGYFPARELAGCFREFSPYIGSCKYKKCTHLREEGCAIIAAVADDIIPQRRHKSYVEIYEILKRHHPWD